MSLNTNLSHHFDVRQPHHDLLHAVHLQGAHAAFHSGRKDFGHARTLPDQLLDWVVSNQQLVPTDP